MTDTTLTHKDLAELLGVSETTVKSYRRKFPGCISVASDGKPIRFTSESAEVATRIRDLFETGMSVDEVRLRLAKEFVWISSEGSKRPGKAGAEKPKMAPEISIGVSNMAKSMVAMTQQQKAILLRMQGIEAMLEELGLKGQVDAADLRSKNAEAARAREEKLENRLNRLDESTKGLAGTVHSLADQLGRFLGRRAEAARDRQKNALNNEREEAGEVVGSLRSSEAAPPATGDGSAESSRITGPAEVQTASPAAGHPHAPEHSPAPSAGSPGGHEAPGAKIIPLRPESAAAHANRSEAPPGDGQVVGHVPSPASSLSSAPAEPPRHLLSLPLVVRTGQGQYISAGGRGRGRFCINDLKAMLIYGYAPPNHFTLHWEAHDQGWWLTLEQRNQSRAIHLLLMELPTQKGTNVTEILQLKKNEETLHPAEICGIIDSFSE